MTLAVGHEGSPIALHSWFVRSAEQHPDAIALTIGARQWTYGETRELALLWAGALLNMAPRLSRVGILATRSEESYIGLLAVAMAGASAVPLNPAFPVERNLQIAQAAGLDAVLVDAAGMPQLERLLAAVPTALVAPNLDLPRGLGAPGSILDRAGVARRVALQEPRAVPGDAVAYILFTSGSTGRPKGVPVTHANIGHFLSVNHARYRLSSRDRLSQTFEQTFDLAMFDLFMAWGSGARVCSMSPLEALSPVSFVNRNAITVWFSVPSVAALLRRKGALPPPGSMPSLCWSLFCGEPLPRWVAEAWQEAAPNAVVENLYGPTELTISCAAHRWDPRRSPAYCVNDIVPIGRLYEGLSCVLLGDDGRTDDREGELCVRGPQLFPGYLDPRDNEGRFITFEEPAGRTRWYRTGDRVRRLEDGELAFLGRIDQQVKIRGYRVELGEIEAALRSQAGVVEAVVLALTDPDGQADLVAFVSGEGLDAHSLLQTVSERLPWYMVPRRLWHLAEVPHNRNGKVDRPALRRRAQILLSAQLAQRR